jgi:hypothetical protein
MTKIPHTYMIEDRGRKQIDPQQLKFKQFEEGFI